MKYANVRIFENYLHYYDNNQHPEENPPTDHFAYDIDDPATCRKAGRRITQAIRKGQVVVTWTQESFAGI